MSSLFKVPVKIPKKNRFDLSHDMKASGKMGKLIPVLALDCIPGDEMSIGINSFFRFLPLVATPMHKVKVKTTFFFVPNRILCPTWETFILADQEGEDPIAAPTFNWTGGGNDSNYAAFTVGGYMGLPGLPSGVFVLELSAFPIAAYHRIYEEYYRPQHLEDPEVLTLTPGNTNLWVDDIANHAPLNTNWALDYFTSALPYPQWGSEAVRIPVGGQDVILQPNGQTGIWVDATTGVDDGFTDALNQTVIASDTRLQLEATNVAFDPQGTLVTDPNSAGTIDDLLRANALQNWLRRTARAGNRYVEQMKAMFGVPVQDSRLQRPEFIGTVRQLVNFSEVLATAETEAPLGTIAGQATSRADSGKLYYKAKEHGWVIGLLTVMPTSAYQDGVARKWLRSDRFDYAWPDFANIGEQPVYNMEIYANIPENQRLLTWGYQSRYAEYKIENSRVAGLLRGDLDFWHLGRKFQDLPPLSKGFVQTANDGSTFSRVFADLNGEHFVFHINFDIQAKRPLPRFGIPAI